MDAELQRRMDDNYVTRREFEQYCDMMQGSLSRIEKALEKINGRPQWAVSVIITLLSSAFVATLATLITLTMG